MTVRMRVLKVSEVPIVSDFTLYELTYNNQVFAFLLIKFKPLPQGNSVYNNQKA